MAKPILVVHVNPENTNDKLLIGLKNGLEKDLDNEYHVLMVSIPTVKEVKFECFNDCKGLPDIDIEALITSINLTDGQSSKEQINPQDGGEDAGTK